MSWITLTEAHLAEQFSGTEIEAFRAAALADDQPDPIAPALENITSLVRGYVASNSKVTIDTDTTTIPERLKIAALDIAIVDIMKRAAGTMVDPDGARATAKRDALNLLKDVAAGKFSIEDPITGAESNQAVTPSYTPTRKRKYTRESQDGI